MCAFGRFFYLLTDFILCMGQIEHGSRRRGQTPTLAEKCQRDIHWKRTEKNLHTSARFGRIDCTARMSTPRGCTWISRIVADEGWWLGVTTTVHPSVCRTADSTIWPGFVRCASIWLHIHAYWWRWWCTYTAYEYTICAECCSRGGGWRGVSGLERALAAAGCRRTGRYRNHEHNQRCVGNDRYCRRDHDQQSTEQRAKTKQRMPIQTFDGPVLKNVNMICCLPPSSFFT